VKAWPMLSTLHSSAVFLKLLLSNRTRVMPIVSNMVNDVKSNTAIELFTFDANDIKVMKILLPSTLKAIKGTATLHEFIVEKYGKVFMKEASDKPPKEIKDF
jgi:hypothetical protein